VYAGKDGAIILEFDDQKQVAHKLWLDAREGLIPKVRNWLGV
jgi:hypothetical protein